MATITINYDARKPEIKKAIELLIALGVEVIPHKRSGLDEALEDADQGRVREITDLKAYFKKLGADV